MFYLMSKDEEFIAFKAYQAWAERQTGTKLKCKWTDWGGEFLSDEHKMYLKENWTSDISAWLTTTKWTSRKVPTNHSQWSTEAMWHHAGLSDRFWIHTVKVKVHTYNITPIKRAGYKTPTELFRGVKPNISHLQVFGCQAWVHILKKRQTKLEAKSWEVIFVSYELGSKGYQFWDAANRHFKISCDVKFDESQFPVKEKSLAQPGSASLNDHQFSKKSTQGESDDNLGLVTLDQPPQGPTSPGPPAPVAQPPQPLILPLSPPGESILTLPDMGTAPTPWYSLRPWDKSGHVIKTLKTDKDNSLGHMMIHMFWIHSERQWPLQRQKNGKRYQKRNSGASLIWVSGNWSQDQNIARWSNACGHMC